MNFFDFQESQAQKKAQGSASVSASADTLTVSQVTSLIERALKAGVPQRIHVKGEVSNFNFHRTSGHLYFTLKDAAACIDCVMFKSDATKLKFTPDDGMELIGSGRVAIYPARGRYQLYVTSLHPVGRGALELAFAQLREKLDKAGLFDADRKTPLPAYPSRIVILTSRQTAALQDILKVLKRFPFLSLSVFHVPVQGDGAAERIAVALRALQSMPFDVIILARGGGSLEDLWAFNEEVVARAIAASRLPVITGIGHEVDVSIADLVADYHAHTPTEAAQVAIAQWREAAKQITNQESRLSRSLRAVVTDARQRLSAIERHELFRRPLDRLGAMRQLIDERERSLSFLASKRISSSSGKLSRLAEKMALHHPRTSLKVHLQRLANAEARVVSTMRTRMGALATQIEAKLGQLNALSPQAVLGRGYSITTLKRDRRVIRNSTDVRSNDVIVTQLKDGLIESIVKDSSQSELFE